MPASVFAIVLFAALLHAGWNAIVKRFEDTLATTVLVAAAAAAIAVPLLCVLPTPARASWPFIALSACLQVLYFVLVAAAYRLSEMSQAYPLMRGAAPLLVALGSIAYLSESLQLGAWVGIVVICCGVLSMLGDAGRGSQRRGVVLALINAGVIAAYTLVDAVGVRRSQSPAAYTLWIFLLTGCVMAGWVLVRWRSRWLRHARRHWRLGLAGGAATVSSYGLALWAMTRAPVAPVAALRESSILFGVAISGIVLGERPGAGRIAASGLIAAGAICLRLA